MSDPQSLNPYVYVENAPAALTDPSGMGDYGPCTLTGGWGSCLQDTIDAGAQWYGGLSPEERQYVNIGILVAATYASGGLDLLAVGG